MKKIFCHKKQDSPCGRPVDTKASVVIGQKYFYRGTYNHNNEDIEITSGFSLVRKLTKYAFEPAYCIYTGKGNYNIFTEEYVVQVEGADAEISDYKAGDVIVFQKVNGTQTCQLRYAKVSQPD